MGTPDSSNQIDQGRIIAALQRRAGEDAGTIALLQAALEQVGEQLQQEQIRASGMGTELVDLRAQIASLESRLDHTDSMERELAAERGGGGGAGAPEPVGIH